MWLMLTVVSLRCHQVGGLFEAVVLVCLLLFVGFPFIFNFVCMNISLLCITCTYPDPYLPSQILRALSILT